MLKANTLYEALKNKKIGLITGVPDSLLSSFCAYVDDHAAVEEHIITANEGNAIALAAGHHMATGKVSAVYMQNSGLGNAINPLTSLTDPEVYRIPMLLIIGWRGEPGVKDEPQHIKQGRITERQLELLEIPYCILDVNSDLEGVIEKIFQKIKSNQAPAALLVKKDTFEKYQRKSDANNLIELKREAALKEIIKLTMPSDLVISTTGKTSRELFEIRSELGQPHNDFLTVGSMGHTASIALGVALGQPDRRVICLDGDGSLIMHMGSLAITGSLKPKNLIHVLLNNCCHESVGGQPTTAGKMNFKEISKACGYNGYLSAVDIDSIINAWEALSNQNGPILLELKLQKGARSDLGRPSKTPEENKLAFMACTKG